MRVALTLPHSLVSCAPYVPIQSAALPSHLFKLFFAFTRRCPLRRRHLSCSQIRSPNTSCLHYAKRHTQMSSRKGSLHFLRSWHVMRQAAGTRYLVKEARDDERRWKQWVGCFLGRTAKESAFLYCPQPAPIAVCNFRWRIPIAITDTMRGGYLG